VSNVLNEQTKQQVIALGRLGWSLRRIQKATGVRRETAAAYLREAGGAVRPPGLWGHRSVIADLPPATATGADAGPPPAEPAIEVTTDVGAELATSPDSCEAHPDTDGTIVAVPPAVATAVVADPAHAKPAIGVTTEFGVASTTEATPSEDVLRLQPFVERMARILSSPRFKAARQFRVVFLQMASAGYLPTGEPDRRADSVAPVVFRLVQNDGSIGRIGTCKSACDRPTGHDGEGNVGLC
jgi:hypothetical protein